jgi:hypothetical protein
MSDISLKKCRTFSTHPSRVQAVSLSRSLSLTTCLVNAGLSVKNLTGTSRRLIQKKRQLSSLVNHRRDGFIEGGSDSDRLDQQQETHTDQQGRREGQETHQRLLCRTRYRPVVVWTMCEKTHTYSRTTRARTHTHMSTQRVVEFHPRRGSWPGGNTNTNTRTPFLRRVLSFSSVILYVKVRHLHKKYNIYTKSTTFTQKVRNLHKKYDMFKKSTTLTQKVRY